MKDYIIHDEWKIIEDQYNSDYNEISESLCSIGNGHMGQRANFEETYSGKTLQGSYVGGVYYPDKTKVGWWKNGYPEYFAKVLNSVNWIGLNIKVNGEVVDLAKAKTIHSFHRELDMMNGLLTRQVDLTLQNGNRIRINTSRFVSMDEVEAGVISYNIEAVNFSGKIEVESYLDNGISNKDSNYDEKFWLPVDTSVGEETIFVSAITKKTGFTVAAAAYTQLSLEETVLSVPSHTEESEMYVSQHFSVDIQEGQTLSIEKYCIIASSLNHEVSQLQSHCTSLLDKIVFQGYDQLETAHSAKWHGIWGDCDITIEGDVSAQQGIRFNIFQLYQTYTGRDTRLNIGPKGFTGEKYGGSTYWDTEAYCLPFYLSTTDSSVGRNLLIYRHNHLGKAIENAEKLGFTNGAALYPMVTMNGEECHNEWEITFEEIHRNGAIAYAIYDYINYTGDQAYMAEYGLDVLIGIARFWAQRVNWSANKQKYVMLGVTGPNEYENNVNNNWYTNYIAAWCLQYTKDQFSQLRSNDSEAAAHVASKNNLQDSELVQWQKVVDQMYYPEDEKLGIFLQQDGFLDKEQLIVDDLTPEDRPLNQNWSWDRILRSIFIKQADVLQGLYFFEDQFDEDTHRRNFDYYEPRTVHESSLSPCVHSILAAKLGMEDKSYEMYLRTSRLDLNDYNNDTEDGLHITSMAGTWLSVIKGFGGMRVKEGRLHFTPFVPKNWEGIGFKIKFRGAVIKIHLSANELIATNEGDKDMTIFVNGDEIQVAAQQNASTKYR